MLADQGMVRRKSGSTVHRNLAVDHCMCRCCIIGGADCELRENEGIDTTSVMGVWHLDLVHGWRHYRHYEGKSHTDGGVRYLNTKRYY